MNIYMCTPFIYHGSLEEKGWLGVMFLLKAVKVALFMLRLLGQTYNDTAMDTWRSPATQARASSCLYIQIHGGTESAILP